MTGILETVGQTSGEETTFQLLPKSNKRILKLPEGHNYTNLKVTKDLIQFYCNGLETEYQVTSWVELFGNVSSVKWIQTTNYKTEHIYRIVFRCKHHHCFTNKDKQNCPVRLVIKRFGNLNDPEGEIQTLVILYNEHNHNTVVSTSNLGNNSEINDKVDENSILQMYAKGHTPDSVSNILHFDKFVQLSSNRKVADTKRISPSLKYRFNTIYKKHKSSIPVKSCEDSIKDILQKWINETDGYAAIGKDNDVAIITLVTPFMRSVYSTCEKSRETIFLEKIVSLCKSNLSVYSLSFRTTLGELPVCYIIISSSQPIFLKKGLQQFLSFNENISFSYGNNGTNDPKYIIINDNIQESVARIVRDVWPTSTIIMSPQYIIKTIWSWLSDYPTVNETIFLAFKNVLTARNENDVIKFFQKLQTASFSGFMDYFYTFWNIKEAWCFYYFKEAHSSAHLEKTYISYFVQDIKNVLIKCAEEFNLTQLVDFIITRLDLYYNKRLMDIVDKNFQISKLRTLLPETSVSWETIAVIDDNTFLIKGVKEVNYIVDVSLGFCTCSVGMNDSICEHLNAVILYHMKCIEGTPNVCSFSDIQKLLKNTRQSNKTTDKNSWKDNNSLQQNEKSVDMNSFTNTSMSGSHKGIEVSHTNILFSDSDSMEVEYNSYTEELTATDVMRIMNCQENPFSQNLRTVFKEIIDRVKNNPDLHQAATNFCRNYKKYCGNNSLLMLSLNGFSEFLKSSVD